MALNNCSITSQSFSRQSGTAIGADNATLIITPAQGYVLNAADFSVDDVTYTNNGNNLQWTSGNNGVTLPTGVSSITLSNTGVANSVGNNISVLVDLTDSFVMPDADTTLVIDIDGSANLQSYSLSGNYSTTVSGATPSSESSTYSGSGNFGQQVTVLTKVFSADSGTHFETLPSYVLTAKNSSRYDISRTTTGSDSDGNVTQVTFTVKYTFSNESETGDSIAFTANTVAIFSPAVEIQDYGLRTIVIETIGEERKMTVFGVPGAQFSLTVQNQASQSILSISNQTLDSTGSHSFIIEFPGILATATDQYDFVLTGDGVSTNFGGTDQKPHTFSIKQLGDVTVQAGLTHTSADVTISANKSITARANRDLADEGDLTHSFTITSDKFLILTSTTVDLTTFTNLSNNGGTEFVFESLTFTRVSDNQITATLDAEVDVIGNENVTTLYSLDTNIKVNNKSFVEDVIEEVDRNSTKKILIAGRDIDGDNLTFEIVDPPEQGSLARDANGNYDIKDYQTYTDSDGIKYTIKSIDYTHSGSLIFSDSFTYKAKDPFEDSTNTAEVELSIQNQAPSIDFINGVAPVNDTITLNNYIPGEQINIRVVVSDPNNDILSLTRTLPNNGAYSNTAPYKENGDFIFPFDAPANTDQASSSMTISLSDGDLSDSVVLTINYDRRPEAFPDEIPLNKGETKEITLEGEQNGGTALSYIIVSLPSQGALYTDATKSTQIVQSGLPYTLAADTVHYEHNNTINLEDEFKFKVNNGRDSFEATIDIIVGVPAETTGFNFGIGGGKGIFIIPVVVGTASGRFDAFFDSIGVPDRFELLFNTSDTSNNYATASVVADSLYVGAVSNTTPARVTENIYQFVYVGQNGNSGDPNEGAPVVGVDASGNDVYISNDDHLFDYIADSNGNPVAVSTAVNNSDIANPSVRRKATDPNGPGHGDNNNQNGDKQKNVQIRRYSNSTTFTDDETTCSAAEVGLYFSKPKTQNAVTIFIRITGSSVQTGFNIHKTTWTPN
jgi:hypothetical protein